ncbi:MAG: tRNA (adenosine(37)-N6)-threonylcarbamoyltransferase complex ATPase subunit type 1 TsaE [Christensenellales bacterium]
MQVLKSMSESQTETIGRLLGEKMFRGGFVSIAGELGSGKTVLVRGIARGLQIEGPVRSPSFVLMNQYQNGRLPLYHFDVYRLKSSEEINTLGYEEYFFGDGVAVLEWPQMISDFLPEERLDIHIKYIDEQKRNVELKAFSPAYQAILEDTVKEYESSVY